MLVTRQICEDPASLRREVEISMETAVDGVRRGSGGKETRRKWVCWDQYLSLRYGVLGL